jgi:hypothetical protein
MVKKKKSPVAKNVAENYDITTKDLLPLSTFQDPLPSALQLCCNNQDQLQYAEQEHVHFLEPRCPILVPFGLTIALQIQSQPATDDNQLFSFKKETHIEGSKSIRKGSTLIMIEPSSHSIYTRIYNRK